MTTCSRSSDFDNHWHDYRPNWTQLSTIAIKSTPISWRYWESDECYLHAECDFRYFLFCPCWWERRLNEFDRTVSYKKAGLTDWNVGTLKFLVCWLNILNKSDKHYLPFHDSFYGLEAHIHLDFHLGKYIFIITFMLGKVRGLSNTPELSRIVRDTHRPD